MGSRATYAGLIGVMDNAVDSIASGEAHTRMGWSGDAKIIISLPWWLYNKMALEGLISHGAYKGQDIAPSSDSDAIRIMLCYS